MDSFPPPSGPAQRLLQGPHAKRKLLAVVLLGTATIPAIAVTKTWDGGGADSSIHTAANWTDNTTPANDISNTALIFAGSTKTFTVLVAPSFGVQSITFAPGAAAFTMRNNTATNTYNIGLGGVVNNSTAVMTFETPVDFTTFTSTAVEAASGALVFEEFVDLGTRTLFVRGANATSFSGIGGSGSVVKFDAGTMTYSGSANFDLSVTAGTVNTGAVFSSLSAIGVSGTGSLNFEQNSTLNGAQLTRETGRSLTIAAGKTLTIQNSGVATITGTFSNSTASTLTVTGAGSAFSATSTLTLAGGGITNVLAGGAMSSGSAGLTLGSGAGGNSVNVDGSGSALSGGILNVGQSGTVNSLDFSNGSTGTFAAVEVDDSVTADTIGELNILSGADITGTLLRLAPNAVANEGAITIDGVSSTLTLTGAATATIGAASGSSGTLTVQNSGTFSSGTGLTSVNATGQIIITGGTFNAPGGLTLNGGDLTRDATGVLNLAATKTMTVQAGGDATLTGAFTPTASTTTTVTGAGSTLSATTGITLAEAAVMNVLAGGAVTTSTGSVNLGSSLGSGTLLVDGAGSSVSAPAGSLRPGLSGGAGTVTFRNSATGNFSTLGVDNSSTAGSNGALHVESGASVSASVLLLANNAVANTGTVNVTGAGSAITLSGASASTIGAGSASSGTLNVLSGGAFSTGPGTLTVNATGAMNVTGGTFTANGNVTFNGGQLTRSSTGALVVAAGKTLTLQSGGDAIITGNLTHTTASTITVTGSGSTASISSGLTLGGGGGVTVSGAGASLTALDAQLASSGVGSLSFSNGSSGGLRDISTNNGLVAGTGSLGVLSGATLTARKLAIASAAADNSGSATVDGTSSTLTLADAGGTASQLTIGASGFSTGVLTVANGGTLLADGTLPTLLNASGVANLTNGGTARFKANVEQRGRVNISGSTFNLIKNAVSTSLTLFPGSETHLTGNATATYGLPVSFDGGVFNVEAGSRVVFDHNLNWSGNFTGTGTVNLRGGANEATGFPVGPAGPLQVSCGGNLEASSTTPLIMQIGGTTPGTQHDQVMVAGGVIFTPSFELHFINGFAPKSGDVFNLVVAGGQVPQSATARVMSGLRPGWRFRVEVTQGPGVIRMVSLNDAVATGDGTVWDGGGTDNLITTPANWLGNVAPPSSLTSGLLVFTGNVRPQPQLSAPFSARGVYLTDNVSTVPFTIGGPHPLRIGDVGIVNESTGEVLTFDCPVDFSGSAQGWTSGGDVTFNGNVTLPAGTLNLNPAAFSEVRLCNVVGAGGIAGLGNILISPTAGVQQYDLSLPAGKLTTVADGSTDVFGSTANLTVENLAINESLTLDGASLTVKDTGFTLAAGKTLLVSGGGVVDTRVAGLPLENGGTVTATGAGSRLIANAGQDSGCVNARLEVLAGASALMGAGNLSLQSSQLVVDGAGSSLQAAKLTMADDLQPSDVAFRHGSAGNFSGTLEAEGSGSFEHRLRIESGSTVSFGAGDHHLVSEGTFPFEFAADGTGSALSFGGQFPQQIKRIHWISSNGGTLTLPNSPVAMESCDVLVTNGTFQVPGGLVLSNQSAVGMVVNGGGTSHLTGDLTLNSIRLEISGAGTRAEFHGTLTLEAGELVAAANTTSVFHGPVRSIKSSQELTFNGRSEFRGGLSVEDVSNFVDFNDSVTLAAANVLTVRIADPSIHNRFRFLGSAVLGGTLRIVLENGYAPDPGNEFGAEFQVFEFDPGAIGATRFAAYDLPTLSASLAWDLSELYATGIIRVVDASGPFGVWRRSHFGPIIDYPNSARLADPDHDGIANLLEYGLGLNPLVGSTAGLPTVSLTTIGANKFLTLTFSRPLSTTDAYFEVRVGSTLREADFRHGSSYGVYGDVPNTLYTTQVSRIVGTTTEIITVRDNTPVSAANARFMRLDVEVPIDSP